MLGGVDGRDGIVPVYDVEEKGTKQELDEGGLGVERLVW